MKTRLRRRAHAVLVVAIVFVTLISFFAFENRISEFSVDADEEFRTVMPQRLTVGGRIDLLPSVNSRRRSAKIEKRLQHRLPSKGSEEGQPGREQPGGRPYEELHRLLEQMEGNWRFWWIKKRIEAMWSEFEAVGMKLNNGCRNSTQRKRTQVLILPGVLDLTDFARPEVIRKGGPLGELMQWADLIAASHALCHEVLVRTQFSSTAAQLRADIADEEESNQNKENQVDGCRGSLDYIYTDISGFKALPEDITNAYRERFRIADAFGTEAAYNDPEYATSHGIANRRWGMLNLRLKQFYTLYPHSPDNSFLGFVVSRSKLFVNSTKENYALIMGKETSYLQKNKNLLRVINEFFPLRATMSGRAVRWLPPGAETVGIVDSSRYQELLRNAKVCVGLGDPIESPGVLEAIARGCVFLNPRRKGDRMILRGKPTGRLVSSQVPYLEDYVGPPHVYTIDEDNVEELERILQKIRTDKVEPFLPFEFSVEGFLRRLDAYTEHQDFCRRPRTAESSSLWPPVSALRTVVAPSGTSCARACFDKHFVCEPLFFPIINSPEYFQNATALSCDRISFAAELHSPSVSSTTNATKTCYFQRRESLFSCAGGESGDHRRVCPCRDFQPFQLAFCKQCTNTGPREEIPGPRTEKILSPL